MGSLSDHLGSLRTLHPRVTSLSGFWMLELLDRGAPSELTSPLGKQIGRKALVQIPFLAPKAL